MGPCTQGAKNEHFQNRNRSKSRSKENVLDSRESLDKNKKQSIGKEFVNFYMDKLK